MGTYKDLTVWQKSMDLTRKVYKATSCFPESERFGLIIQMRRSAVSIPSNIAEGYGREGWREHAHFLYISLGSSNELETQLILSNDFGYISIDMFEEIIGLNSEVNKMLCSLLFKEKQKNS